MQLSVMFIFGLLGLSTVLRWRSVLGQHPNIEAMTNVCLLKSVECTNPFIIILPLSFSKLATSVTEKLPVWNDAMGCMVVVNSWYAFGLGDMWSTTVWVNIIRYVFYWNPDYCGHCFCESYHFFYVFWYYFCKLFQEESYVDETAHAHLSIYSRPETILH